MSSGPVTPWRDPPKRKSGGLKFGSLRCCDFRESIQTTTFNTAHIVGMELHYGQIAPGAPARFNFYDEKLTFGEINHRLIEFLRLFDMNMVAAVFKNPQPGARDELMQKFSIPHGDNMARAPDFGFGVV